MTNLFHKFLNPHCPDCKADKEDSQVNQAIEVLKLEIERLRYENERLLDSILDKPVPVIEPAQDRELKPVRVGSHVPFRVRREMREQEDRIEAAALKKAAQPKNEVDLKEIEELENEIEKGLANANQ